MPQSDSSLGTISGHILSYCGLQLLSSITGILLLSCDSEIMAPLELQLSLLLYSDGLLCRVVLYSFGTRFSSQIFVWLLLSISEGLLSSYFGVLISIFGRGIPIYVWCLGGLLSTCGEGNFPSFGGGILCHWDKGLLSFFSKGLGDFSLVALDSGVSQSLCYSGTLLQMWCAGSSLHVVSCTYLTVPWELLSGCVVWRAPLSLTMVAFLELHCRAPLELPQSTQVSF